MSHRYPAAKRARQWTECGAGGRRVAWAREQVREEIDKILDVWRGLEPSRGGP